jgi:hypothetical protein
MLHRRQNGLRALPRVQCEKIITSPNHPRPRFASGRSCFLGAPVPKSVRWSSSFSLPARRHAKA